MIAGHQTDRTRTLWPKLARALRATRAFLFAMTGVAFASCAATNYDFAALADESAPSRVNRLSQDLVLEQEDGKHDELYDIAMIPLARTHLNVFTESDDKGIPDGFLEADVNAYLPLFSFVNAKIRRYDTDRRMYESHRYKSYLWGLFQVHREQIDTTVGLRKKKRLRFLWFFDWTSSPKYVEAGPENSSQPTNSN